MRLLQQRDGVEGAGSAPKLTGGKKPLLFSTFEYVPSRYGLGDEMRKQVRPLLHVTYASWLLFPLSLLRERVVVGGVLCACSCVVPSSSRAVGGGQARFESEATRLAVGGRVGATVVFRALREGGERSEVCSCGALHEPGLHLFGGAKEVEARGYL